MVFISFNHNNNARGYTYVGIYVGFEWWVNMSFPLEGYSKVQGFPGLPLRKKTDWVDALDSIIEVVESVIKLCGICMCTCMCMCICMYM